jgi:hypothetical protein
MTPTDGRVEEKAHIVRLGGIRKEAMRRALGEGDDESMELRGSVTA